MHLDIQLGIAGIGQGAGLAILAIGLVVIYSGSGVLNFGHGAVATFTTYLFVWLRDNKGWATGPAFCVGIAVSAGIGLVFYVLVMRPLRHAPPLAKVVATIGLLVFLQALLDPLFGFLDQNQSPLLPTGRIELPLGSPHFSVGRDRLFLFAIAIGLTTVMTLIMRRSAFGLRARALGDSDVAVAVAGHSPDVIASINWALGSALAGVAGMLLSTLAPIDPSFYTVLMVMAIAAALLGGFRSFSVMFGAAILIGMIQPIVARYGDDLKGWTGLQGWTDSLPLILIIVVFVARGRGLPVRDLIVTRPLPRVTMPRHLMRWGIGGIAIGVGWLVVVPRAWVGGTTTTMVYTLFALSLVVAIGYIGQVSLAQMSFAGAGAFSAAQVSTSLGLPFPLPIIVGALIAVPVGVIFGLPALRVRGINLAVVTLALSIAAQNMFFSDSRFTGGDYGKPVAPAEIFGISLDSFKEPRRFAIVALVIVVGVALCVAALRRRFLGMEFLATRGNEKGAAASGVSLVRAKLMAFAISSFVAGAGGGLLAYQVGRVSTASFDPLQSVFIAAFAYIGGIGSIAGAFLAGLLAPFGLFSKIIGVSNNWIDVLGGLGLMQIVVLHPDGLAGIPHQFREHRDKKRLDALRRADVEPVEGAPPTGESATHTEVDA